MTDGDRTAPETPDQQAGGAAELPFELEEPIEPEPTGEAEPAAPVVEEEPPEVEAPAEVERRVFAGTGISWAFIFGTLVTVAIIVLAVQNTDPVPIQLYFWKMEAPLIIVMLVTALAAIVIDEMIGLIIRRRKRRILGEREELRRLRAQSDTNRSR